jgi:hypothetical protein
MTLRIASAAVGWCMTEPVASHRSMRTLACLMKLLKPAIPQPSRDPYGFLHVNSGTWRQELKQRHLALCSAFVAFHLEKIAAHNNGFAQAGRTLSLSVWCIAPC